MNEWFKKKKETIRTKWTGWSVVQKIIVAAIIVVIVAAIILTARLSSKPAGVRLFNVSVNDEREREQILSRLDQDNVHAYVSGENYIFVDDEKTAKNYRSLLIMEGLSPSKADAYALFDTTKWSRTDFDDTVNWKRSIEGALKQHLESLSGIRQANVMLTLPEESVFASTQKPTTASVTLFPQGGSEILENKRTVRGIQSLVAKAVEGLPDSQENIVIIDGETGKVVNDFDGMAEFDRLESVKKQEKIIRDLEAEYSSRILKALSKIFSPDRVTLAGMKVEYDMSQETASGTRYSGITLREDNPNTPYDDSEIVQSLVLSEETVNKNFTGTGYNPEGPAGIEGQNPPVYSDMSNVIGKSTEEGAKRNYALNSENYTREKVPSMERRTVSVSIDGVWNRVKDEKGHEVIEDGRIKREYTPVSDEVLSNVTKLVQDSIGYDKARDSVTVVCVPVDRTEQFDREDRAFFRAQNRQRTIMFSLIGIAVILVAFIAFRVISREIERRRRLAEEARIRQQEEERQRALLEAQQQGMEVTMSVEERKRAELQENAIAMAKEHPEDVAMLIRTWLMEE